MKSGGVTIVLAGLVLSGNPGSGAATNYASFSEVDKTYTSVVSPTSVPIPDGTGFVAIGAFLGGVPATVGADAGTDLAAAFTAYAQSRFGGFTVNFAGGAFSGLTNDLIPDTLNGQPVFMVFGNALALAGSTEVAVVRTNMRFFDDDPDNPIPAAFDLSLADQDLSTQTAYGTVIAPVDNTALEQFGLQNTGRTLQLEAGPATAKEITDPPPSDTDFLITDVARAGNGEVSLTWNSQADKTYAVDFSEDLATWREIQRDIPSAGSSTSTSDSSNTSLLDGYYRVREQE